MPLRRNHPQRTEDCATCSFEESRPNCGESQSSPPAGRISEGHRQKATISRQMSIFESSLSQSLSPAQWMRLDKHCHTTAERVKQAVKEKQILKFNTLKCKKIQQLRPQTTLDHSKLVHTVNLSSRLLSSTKEEVLALGLSFAVAPSHIPYEDIIAATEATAHRLDHRSADTLRLGVSTALRRREMYSGVHVYAWFQVDICILVCAHSCWTQMLCTLHMSIWSHTYSINITHVHACMHSSWLHIHIFI